MVEQITTSRGTEEARTFGLESPDPNVERGPWCRMCQAEKRADNHWFETEEVVGWQGLEGIAQLVVRPLQLPLAKGRDPICGEACLQKRVAIWAGAHLLPGKALR